MGYGERGLLRKTSAAQPLVLEAERQALTAIEKRPAVYSKTKPFFNFSAKKS
jgi:hypothetical protein